MGKSKDDNKRKRSSPSSPRDESRSKRHRDKEEDKKHKSSKKKHKSDKSSKRHSDKDKKSGGKHKHKSNKHDVSSIVGYKELSSDDYFSKNNEFALWLKEEKDIFFSDLSSDSARNLFSDFVSEWNDKRLEPRYYEGIAAGPRTSHKWNLKR